MMKKQIWSHVFFGCIAFFACLSNLRAQNLFFEKISGQEFDPSTSIHGIAKDAVGYIWFGTWNGVYRYDGKTFDYYYHNANDKNSLPNNRIRNIVSDKQSGLWFLTFDKKYVKFNHQLDNFKIIEEKYVPQAVISKLSSNSNALNRDKLIDGKHYYLSSHLFSELDLKTRKEFYYTANINQPGRLQDDYVTSFFIDNQNIIWIGTRGGDIYKANPNRNPFELHYSYVAKSQNSKLATVRAILKEGNQIWLGTDEGMLIYDANGFVVNHPFYRSNSKIDQVRTLFRDPKGGIWIGGVNGLEYYDSKTNSCKPIINRALSPNLETWSVYAIEAYEDNTIWVGLYNGLASVNLSDHKIAYFDLVKEVNDRSVMDILCDGDKLWLATEGNGVIRLKINKQLEISSDVASNGFRNGSEAKQKLAGSIVYALHKDKKGFVWAGTSEGLYKINTKIASMEVENIQLRITTPNTYISAITDDARGNLWVAHKEGISVVNIQSGAISNYQNKDKFGSWRFLERALYKDVQNNVIYFGSKNGYVSFNPAKIKTITKENQLILKSLFVSNQKIVPMDTIFGKPILTKTLSETKEIQLDYDNRSFVIEIASFNYSDTQKEVYEYRLEGYNDDWIKNSSGRLSFTQIPPGNYTLKLRLVSADNDAPITELQIEVNAPWYASWWARLFFAIFIVGIVYWVFTQLLYRDRLKNEIENERLNALRQEELNKEKIEFFTNISHDLKTPLTLIVDPLKRLQDDKLATADKEVYFSIVDRNINYLSKLIAQILDFRKSETGKLKLNPTTQDFKLFMEDCYNRFKFISTQRNINLQFHAPENNLTCSLDFEKVEQIMTNIVSNAFKYTADGGLVAISVRLNEDQSFIETMIEDNGVGIAAAELEKIFEPFNNVGPSPFYGYSSGIGLSLTRNLVQFLNGSIIIDSVVKQGTKVVIKLPYVPAVLEHPTVRLQDESFFEEVETVKITEEELPFETAKPTVLIVEDNPDIQIYLSKELSKDYLVLQEYDGKKGLETAIKQIPDIIVSDIMMPEMEGTELCKALKNDENTCHIPVILLTAKGADESKIEAYNLGAEAYVMKPFNVDVLRAQLKSVLENRIILQKKLAGITTLEQLQEEIPNQDNEFLEKIIHLIQLNMEDVEFNSEELAKLLNISSRQLYRKLKGITGNTVHEFITKVKMNQAEELLKNSDLSISQIAYKLGFSEPSNFSRTFSKHFGCSPSQFLK